MRKRHMALALWVPVILVCSSCSGEEISSPLQGAGWESELQALRQQDISEFAQKVLEDNVITEQEVSQARSNFVTCINESGRLEAKSLPEGGFEYTGVAIGTDEYKAIIDGCDKKTTTMPLIMYFNSMRKNPENIDYNALMAHCMVKQGVVDPAYSGTDYENDLEKYFREEKNSERGALDAPAFIDKQKGPDVHERCTSMSAQEILGLP